MSTFFGTDWEAKFILPNIYKEFYEICSGHTPYNLVGTDLLNTHPEGLNIYAEELLAEDGVENFLESNDLVFLMHQGYFFCYFKADGNPDPEVFYYHEGRKQPESCGPFSIYIKAYIKETLPPGHSQPGGSFALFRRKKFTMSQPEEAQSATPATLPKKQNVPWFRIIIWILLLGFIAIQFFQVEKNNNAISLQNDITSVVTIPDSVQSTLQAACYDCHSNNTNYPWYTNIQPVGWWLAKHIKEGKSQLNFNEFVTYSPQQQKEELEAIAGSVRDGWMPLNSYTWIHKKARLSQKQKEQIIRWTTEAKKQLSSAPLKP